MKTSTLLWIAAAVLAFLLLSRRPAVPTSAGGTTGNGNTLWDVLGAIGLKNQSAGVQGEYNKTLSAGGSVLTGLLTAITGVIGASRGPAVGNPSSSGSGAGSVSGNDSSLDSVYGNIPTAATVASSGYSNVFSDSYLLA